jgi:hypothetical protein
MHQYEATASSKGWNVALFLLPLLSHDQNPLEISRDHTIFD